MNGAMNNPKNLLTGTALLFALLVGLYFAVFSSIQSETEASRIIADFKDVTGLRIGNPVHYRGKQVGFVERLEVRNARAKVHMRLENNLRLHEGAKAILRVKTFLGGRFIEITPGEPDAPFLKERAEIPERIEPLTPVEFAETFGDIAGEIGQSLMRLETLDMKPLSNWSQEKDKAVALMKALPSLSKKLAKFGEQSGQLSHMMQSLETLNKAPDLFERIDSMGERLRRVNEAIAFLQREECVGKLQSVREKIARVQARLTDLFSQDNNLLSKFEHLLLFAMMFDERFIRKILQEEGVTGGFQTPKAAKGRIEALKTDKAKETK